MSTMIREVYEALKDAGASEEKAMNAAEALAREFVRKDADVVATKNDLAQVRDDLRKEMQELRNELRTEMQELRNELRDEMQELRDDLRKEMQALRDAIRQDNQELKELIYKMDSRLSNVEGRLQIIQWLVGFSLLLATSLFVRALFFAQS